MRLNSRINPNQAKEYVDRLDLPIVDWSPDAEKQVMFQLQEIDRVNVSCGKINLLTDSSIPEEHKKLLQYENIIARGLVPPTKYITWGELKKHKLIDIHMGLDYESEIYLNYNHKGYTGGLMGGQGVSGSKEEISKEEREIIGSSFYHSTKAHWMIHDIQEHGLVNPVQGCIYAYHGNNGLRYQLHIHPGSIRQSMYQILDDDSLPILLADPYNYIDSPELTAREHIEIFATKEHKTDDVRLDFHNGYMQMWPGQNTDHQLNFRKRIVEFGKSVFELTEGKPFNIYIGYDSRHSEVSKICQQSILRHLHANRHFGRPSDYECFIPEIKFLDKAKIPEYTREYAGQSTEFTYSRFLIPYLEDYKGISIFMDDDFVWTKSVLPLFMFLHPNDAVACCKYDYDNVHTPETKFVGEKNVSYPKKLWSSFMVFNNSHEDCKKLTPEVVNTGTGKYLHQFEWTNKVSSIPTKYIHNEGYDEEKDKASFGYHFTRGGPWVEGQDCSNINHLHYYNAEKGMLERDGEIKL